MAQSGFTPIQLYSSTTPTAAPSAGNLADGELAINTADGKLFYKDASNNVQVIATKAGSSGDVVGPSSATGNAIALFDGTTGKLIKSSTQLLPSGTVVGTTDAQTLTNKRINPRVSSTTSTATLTPDISAYDQYNLTAQAVSLAVAAPIGTPEDGNKLILRILDNGTSQSVTWDSTYTPVGVVLPTTTTISKITYVGCIYNVANARWDVVAVNTQS